MPAAPAAPIATAARPSTAPEVLFAAISSSITLKEGFTFAHAAASEAFPGSGSSARRQPMFQLPHLCCLWKKLPAYAASAQRQVLQLGPEIADADILAGPALDPEAQQELQVSGSGATVVILQLPH
jgi:hypothetical protein